MSDKPLDVGITDEDLIFYLGQREWERLTLMKKIVVLEKRVEELEPKEPEVKNADVL